jgi:hypothetical protein
MIEQKTISATTNVLVGSEEQAEYLSEKCKALTGIQVLNVRQMASNVVEVQLYLQDITDLWLLGIAVGQKFPNDKY